MTDQLALFGLSNGQPAERVLSKDEAGIRREIPPGPARLLEALIRRGLPPEHLRSAASIVLELDQGADGRP